MQFQYSPYILPLIGAALISIWAIFYTLPRRSVSGASSLIMMAAAITIWLLGYALEIAGANLTTKLFWGKVQYIGIAFVPLSFMFFALRHYRQGSRLQLPVILALSIIPLITIALVFTTETHHLIWRDFHIKSTQNFSALAVSYGSWFWVYFSYSYLLLLTGSIVVARSMIKLRGLYRGQAIVMIIGVLAPWIGNALYVLRLSPIPNLDLTPFNFTITLACLIWGIFGYRLVDLSPIARDLIVEEMRDGVLIIDTRGRITDINPAAGRMIGVPSEQAIGKLIGEVLTPWPHLIERFRDVTDATEEVTIGEGESQRRYEVSISSLHDRQGMQVGRAITVREITEGVVPRPRYAEPVTVIRERVQPELEPAPVPAPRRFAFLPTWLVDFFFPPLKTKILASPGISPVWAQTMERVFTIMLRIVAVLGTITVALSLPDVAGLFVYSLSIIIVAALLWALALWRDLPFRLRVILFLSVIYGMAFIEIYNYGYSVEAFTFFISLAVLGALFGDVRGGLLMLVMSLVTMGVFGVLISQGVHKPAGVIEAKIMPDSLGTAIASLTAYAASAIALVASTNTLITSLNRAWQREMQASNLLQQERDLLEHRITERTRDLAKARDRAVRTSDELRKYFLAIEQSGNTIVITDTKGNIEYANPKFSELTGYTSIEALGQNPRILKSGEHNDEFYKNLWDTISSGHIWYGEFHNKRKDGTLFWESATIAPVMNDEGQITNYVAIKEDITTQKELQEQLREQNEALLQEIAARKRAANLLLESEARFRQIVENASDIIYRTDVKGYFTYVNPTGVRLMNFKDEAEMIGKHYLDVSAPAERHRLKRFYNRQYISRQDTTYLEFPAMTRDGREIWLGQNVRLITEGEKIIGFQAVARDITTIKQTQEALAISRDQALEASQLKGRLLSRVSHELRTPLGAILGFSELLNMDAFGALSDGQKGAVAQIMDSTNYLTQIVNELLDEAQIESKSMTLKMDFFSPKSMLEKMEASMAILARNKGLAFNAKVAPGVPNTLYGDERRLQQVLINLVGNAIKFTRTGEIRVFVYQPSPTHWAMEVEDTGVGIPKEAQSYVFDPFRQVDNTITRENRGTGLGLSITKQLVELMDGEIKLESEVGRGSTFTVTLPILKKQEQRK